MADGVLIQPAPALAKLTAPNGTASPEWLRWYNQIQIAGGTITSNNAAIVAIQARLATDEANITANSNAIIALQNRATTDEANITSNTSAISALQSRAASDEANIAANSSAITALQSRATTDEASITSLQNSTLAKANNLNDVSSRQTALNNLTGTQAAGRYLRSDGTNASLSTIQASDVPTLNQNTTGTAANITGIAAIANGGTGQSTQQAAIDALTGAQSAGKYLRSDGAHATLSSIQASDVPTLNQSTTGNAASATTATNVAGGALGSLPYQSAAGTTALLAGNISTTRKFLSQTGTGTASAAPALVQPDASDLTASFASFTPTVAGGGSMTISSVGVQRAEYVTLGHIAFLSVTVQFTTGGTASNSISISLPAALAGVGINNYVQCTFNNGGGNIQTAIAQLAVNGGSAAVSINLPGYANFPLGGGMLLSVNAVYRI